MLIQAFLFLRFLEEYFRKKKPKFAILRCNIYFAEQVLVTLNPFLKIYEHLWVLMHYIFFRFLRLLLNNNKKITNGFKNFYLFLGTFILKRKSIQIFQQRSFMPSLIQPPGDDLDKSTRIIQKYVDTLKFSVEQSHVLLFLSIPCPVQTLNSN